MLVVDAVATPSVSSPPIAISASNPARLRSTALTPPSSRNGFVRLVFRIVPPRGRIPDTSSIPSRVKRPSIMPRQP